MLSLTQDRTQHRTNRPLPLRQSSAGQSMSLRSLLLVATMFIMTMLLSSCGSSSSSVTQPTATVTGNWQFTMSPQIDSSGQSAYLGGLLGGFIVQKNSAATGAVNYAVSLPQLPYPCNSGSAAVTGQVTEASGGQSVSLTAVAGTQTFTLTGTLSVDGSTMIGTYTSTPGTAPDGSPCGIAEPPPNQNISGLQWSAILVPSITGSIEGNFHSTGGASGLINQDFPVSGSLTQEQNTGANSVTVTGTLSFTSPATNASVYPCFDTASVYGQISGNSVSLQVVGPNQSIIGLVGEPPGSNGVTGINPITYDSAQGGYILHGIGPTYLVATSGCPGSIDSTVTAGDYGNICLAIGSTLGATNACQEPISLIPASLTFPAQAVDTITTQTIMLANTSGSALNGLTLTFANIPASAANYSETDTCGPGGIPSQGVPFNFTSSQSCVITITFNPQCAAQCGLPLTAILSITTPVSPDNDTIFTVPITGSAIGGDAVSSSTSILQDVEHHAEIY